MTLLSEIHSAGYQNRDLPGISHRETVVKLSLDSEGRTHGDGGNLSHNVRDPTPIGTNDI